MRALLPLFAVVASLGSPTWAVEAHDPLPLSRASDGLLGWWEIAIDEPGRPGTAVLLVESIEGSEATLRLVHDSADATRQIQLHGSMAQTEEGPQLLWRMGGAHYALTLVAPDQLVGSMSTSTRRAPIRMRPTVPPAQRGNLRVIAPLARLAVVNASKHFLGYLALAGAAYVLLYVLLRRRTASRMIQAGGPKPGQIASEIRASLLTVLIFALAGMLMTLIRELGWSQLYFEVEERGWVYWGLSLAGLVVLHDAYFYWTHRLFHHPRLFRLFHARHHRSQAPTPWAAYALDPLEAIVTASFNVLIVQLLPVHSGVVVWLVSAALLRSIVSHAGIELFPQRWLCIPGLRSIITVTDHDLHHSQIGCNYGFYFSWWDRWMGTAHADDPKCFQRTAAGRPSDHASPPQELPHAL